VHEHDMFVHIRHTLHNTLQLQHTQQNVRLRVHVCTWSITKYTWCINMTLSVCAQHTATHTITHTATCACAWPCVCACVYMKYRHQSKKDNYIRKNIYIHITMICLCTCDTHYNTHCSCSTNSNMCVCMCVCEASPNLEDIHGA